MAEVIRYMVGHGWAERVQDTTALPHRTLRISHDGEITVRRSWAGEERPPIVHEMSVAELRFLAREVRRASRRHLWEKLFGRKVEPMTEFASLVAPPTRGAHISDDELNNARAIRSSLAPMYRGDGSLDASKVAMEATLRERAGLPSYIIELDGPGRVF